MNQAGVTIDPVPDGFTAGRPLRDVSAIGLLNNFEVFGQERGNIEWYKALRRLGAKVRVGVTETHDGGDLRKMIEDLKFETFPVPYGCQWSKKFFIKKPSLVPSNFARMIACSRVLAKEVKRSSATHVLIGNPLVYSFVAPYLSVNRCVKVMYRMGDEVSHDSLPNKWIWYRFYSRANVIVANSEFVKSSIRRAFRTEPRKVRLIYNVAPSCSKEPVDEVSSREGTRVERLKDGGLEKGCRVLYVGQIAEHKGVSQLLDASIALCREGWDCYFDFVGGSRYTQEYESSMLRRIANERLSDRICFHGRVEDPTSFYRRASVLVVPSLFEEPAANVVLEAKREGVPAIVFPSGGLPELLEDGVTGIVCREKSSHALLEVLRRGFSQPALFEGLGAACLGEYERRFSEARFDKQWEAVFSST